MFRVYYIVLLLIILCSLCVNLNGQRLSGFITWFGHYQFCALQLFSTPIFSQENHALPLYFVIILVILFHFSSFRNSALALPFLV